MKFTKKWFGKHGLLESHHGYIQWLFPIREDGLNHYAQQLQLHEASSIKNDPVLQGRIVKSYELMLDFYGIKLVDSTGKLTRADNWKSRYAHLNRSFHNYLRITRILKCLGEVGLEHMKVHFVEHVLQEIFENNELDNCYDSCVKFWSQVLREEADRKHIQEFIAKHEEASRCQNQSHQKIAPVEKSEVAKLDPENLACDSNDNTAGDKQ